MDVADRRALGSRYELVARLGAGAMGEVWRTWDRVGETYVAAKLLRRDLTRDPEIVTRFIQERSILLELRHPSIVRVHDLVVEGEDLAIVMDLVDGPNLGTHLRSRGTLAAGDAISVTIAVLDALAAAHDQRCLHRDVKPDNVLLASTEDLAGERVKLSDFGIARLAQESTVQATGLLGTPGYMPPELFVHGTFNASSDVYATGVLLYELLAGRTPFSGKGTAHTVGYRHVNVEPPRLPVAPPLWHVVSTMLSKDPTLRLSARATAQALRDLPPEVLAAEALPVQPAPDQWEDAQRTSIRAAPLRVQAAPADLDVGQTNLHAVPAESLAELLAAPGQVEALVPGADPDASSMTQIGAPAPRHAPARLVPGVTSADLGPEGGHRRRWPWVAGVAGVLAVLTVVLLLTGVIGGGDDDGAKKDTPGPGQDAAITATGQGERYATGLEVESAAEYDPVGGVARVTFTYETSRTPLSGELMQVLPASPGETTCPAAEWAGGARVTAINPTVSGLSVRCGWRVDPGTIDQPVEVTADVYVDLEPSSDALQQWLDSAEEATGAALDAVPAGYDYAVQRMQGISISVGSVTRRSSRQPIPYAVLPVWPGGPDPVNPLYRSPSKGAPPTDALRNVAGGGLEAVDVDACRGAIVGGVDLEADFAFRGCTLGVTIGELSAETSFDILPSGS
ncbi:serine/threonine-protein kinase [Nocardioides pantholopis]|uniref:serine/threonine-protein kinase n=1 Tax=Nocardioides pantholopis TaxID=2483798 RepID=UPI000F08167C|nr:serine/threonine-protein kinase [Nocardioides pantholopis]